MKILDIYITQVCNLNCEYCYVDVIKKASTEFPLGQFLERVDLTQYDHIKFFGGEPLLEWEKIKDIVLSLRKKKQKVSFTIVSNGILLDDEKAHWIGENDVEIVISVHPGSRKNLYKKVSLLRSLGNKLGIYIIFNPADFRIALKDILFFSKAGIQSFCFAPEIYGDWNTQTLRALQKVLFSLIPYIQKKSLRISGISHDSLKILTGGCEKTVFDYHGKYSPCNRFISLKEQKDFSYKPIYETFSEYLCFDTNPERWFYTCPVGWYLDSVGEENIQASLENYEKLNQIFLLFFRELHKNTLGFLSPGIEQIRFNLTKQCNIRCMYCYVDFSNEKLEYRVGKNIIDFFLEQEGQKKYISFFGGEPFLEFENLKKLTEYAVTKSQILGKEVYFSVATNFMLMSRERISFLREHNFDIHISFNGTHQHNNILRDSSSELVLKNMQEFLSDTDKEAKVCILFALRPEDIFSFRNNIEYIIKLGYKNFLIELIFGEQYKWSKKLIDALVLQMLLIQKKYAHISYKNMDKEKKYLDISTEGKASDNSLAFFDASIDILHKKYFDDTLLKVL